MAFVSGDEMNSGAMHKDPAHPKYILTEHGVGYLFKKPE